MPGGNKKNKNEKPPKDKRVNKEPVLPSGFTEIHEAPKYNAEEAPALQVGTEFEFTQHVWPLMPLMQRKTTTAALRLAPGGTKFTVG